MLIPRCPWKATIACTMPTKISSHAIKVLRATAASIGSAIASIPRITNSTPSTMDQVEPSFTRPKGLAAATVPIDVLRAIDFHAWPVTQSSSHPVLAEPARRLLLPADRVQALPVQLQQVPGILLGLRSSPAGFFKSHPARRHICLTVSGRHGDELH